MSGYIIGIDIGGTHFRIGAVTKSRAIQHLKKIPAAEVFCSGDTLDDLYHAIVSFMKETEGSGDAGETGNAGKIGQADDAGENGSARKIGQADDAGESVHVDSRAEAVSIGFPATLNRERTVVLQAPNLNFKENLPVVEFLSKRLGIPVYIDRDVNMAIRYDMEKYHIAKEGITCGFYFGTGIGNAICINGTPLTGRNGTAGELGHIPVDGSDILCGCGNRGCMENLAGGKYLAHIHDQIYPETPIEEMFVRHADDALLWQFTDRCAQAVATEVNILDPDHVLIGGGVTAMPAFPKARLRERILARTRKPYPADNLDIIFTEDETDKGVIGAALCAMENEGG